MNWDKRQKLIEDASQYKLEPDLTITKNKNKNAKTKPNIDFTKIVLCPFCLKFYEYQMFRISKGLRVCPNCNSQMKVSTLAKINNLNDLVHFVFDYRHSGFWDKICLDVKPINENTRFNTWNQRLYELILSKAFWDEYKLLKGESGDENEYS